MRPVIGIDPGSRRTGLVLRRGDECLDHAVIVRADGDSLVPTAPGSRPLYVGEVLQAIMGLRFHRALREERDGPALVAVEGINAPTGFSGGRKALLDPSHIVAAGIILGAVLGAYRTVVVVPPDNNGRGFLGSYPEALVTEGERRHGLMREAPSSSVVSHARSAWDVAGRAAMLRT